MSLSRIITISTIGLACKAILNFPGSCVLSVNGLDVLKNALNDAKRTTTGVVTVANHISTVDDPMAWGILPPTYYFAPHSRMRWALGASDIMFTNPLFSKFFRLGNVYETFRGQGIYQHAVDMAIDKLNNAQWVHLFGEGKINQPNAYEIMHGRARLPRFKWGVGRILMETTNPPVIIPMWLSGFDQLMPEGRPFPWKYLPRFFAGVKLSVTFGEPINPDVISAALEARSGVELDTSVSPQKGERTHGWIGDKIPATHTKHCPDHALEDDVARIRSRVTSIIHSAVEDLGRKVDGDLLGAPESTKTTITP
ncbi:hypothetical protein ONZ45_g498 [Pleurotus djamor]|nr:hypothetical protein ONZ45_g498 [Pleurotus djamor]